MTIAPISPGVGLPGGLSITPAQAPATSETSFGKIVDHFLQGANTEQVQADRAVQDLAMGRTDNIHNVMLAVARADLSFRMILELRNRLQDAYQEIMRMQV